MSPIEYLENAYVVAKFAIGAPILLAEAAYVISAAVLVETTWVSLGVGAKVAEALGLDLGKEKSNQEEVNRWINTKNSEKETPTSISKNNAFQNPYLDSDFEKYLDQAEEASFKRMGIK